MYDWENGWSARGKAGIGQDSQNGCKNLVEMEIV